MSLRIFSLLITIGLIPASGGNFKDPILALKNLIARGDFEGSFKDMRRLIPKNGELFNELILLEGRYKGIQSKEREGTLSDEFVILQTDKIRSSLMGLVNEIQQDD